MNIKEQYPNLDQWLMYGGTMLLKTAPGQKIQLLLGDDGGIAEDGKFVVETTDEAIEKANSVLSTWRKETRKTLEAFMSGEIKSTEEEFIQVVGWPPEKNPFYVKT